MYAMSHTARHAAFSPPFPTLLCLSCFNLQICVNATQHTVQVSNHIVPDQAHADALGSWGDNGAARRAWEGDGRIDLRSVTNCLRQLPYHVAWQKGFRQAAGVLNPTVPIDSALETCRELGEGKNLLKAPTLASVHVSCRPMVLVAQLRAGCTLKRNCAEAACMHACVHMWHLEH